MKLDILDLSNSPVCPDCGVPINYGGCYRPEVELIVAAEIVSLLDTPDGPCPAPRPGPAPAPAPGLLQLQVEAPHAPQTPNTLRAAQGVAVKLNKEAVLVRNDLLGHGHPVIC